MSYRGKLASFLFVTWAYALGRWARDKRFAKEGRPLIRHLESSLKTMEADRV